MVIESIHNRDNKNSIEQSKRKIDKSSQVIFWFFTGMA